MLSRREVLFRYIIAAVLFTLAGTGIVTGKLVSWCSILGAIELATAMTRYSPLMELLQMIPVDIHISNQHKPETTIRKA